MLWHSTTSWHIRRYAHRLFVLQFLSVLFDLILGIRKLLTAVDDLIVIRFAPCAFMVLAFFKDFLIIWLDLELIRDIWFIVKHTINARRDYVICAEKFELIISTHTPHARRDMQTVYLTAYRKVFQLTRLMRGVTAECGAAFPPRRFQLTRLMRGVTAPPPRSAHCWIFQLTRLMRGVTV